jgi:glycosyltransferase involved in cell wall biosynthesis
MRSLTILHLAANRWWTGSADPIIRLGVGLTARGHRVLLGTIPGDRFEAKAREAGLALVDGLHLDTGLAPLAAITDVLRLRRVVHAEGVDVVHAHHAHDHWLGWLVAATWGARSGAGRRPLVRTFHNRRSVKGTPLARWLYRRTAAALAVSRRIEAECREAGIPAESVHWIPGSADLSRFDPAADPRPIRDEFKLGGAPVVVSVARLASDRGHDRLLAGFRRLLDEIPDARLLLVGKGEARERLERLTAELGLVDRVVFTGYRDRDLPAFLAAADCFVLMRAGSDESCRAALEAMAAGRPVVAGRVGALPETIAHGESGLLLDDDRPETVASALATILGDPGRRRAMGRAGRRRAEAVFGPDRSVVIVERIYRALG